MKLFKHFNNTFIKLLISYLTITFIITFVLGFTLFSFFSEKYNEQVIKMNNILLSQQRDTIQSTIFKKVEKLYVSISTYGTNPYLADFNYFNNNSIEGKSTTLYEDVEYLKSVLLGNAGIVDNIHIYIPYNKIIISTTWGIQFLKEDQLKSNEPVDWYMETKKPSVTGKWLDTRPMKNSFNTQNTSNGTSYIRSFPLFNTNVQSPSTIVFDINESYISDIMREFNSSPSTDSFIINNNGKIIFSTDKEKLYTDLNSEDYIKRIFNQNATNSSNFVTNINKKDYMISYQQLKQTGWTIIVCTPLNDYFKQSSIIRKSIILFCILSALIGLILTLLFSKSIYNPLKSLIYYIRVQLSENNVNSSEVPVEKNNEYALIKNAFSNLNYKVTKLEKTIIENQPIIKQNIMISLINNAIPSQEDLNEQIKLSGILFSHPNYNCIISDIGKNILHAMEMKDRYYSFYITINEIEKMSEEHITIYPVILSRTRIAIIINSKEPDDSQLSDITNHMLTFMEANFNMSAVFSAGNWVQDPLLLYNVYEEAVKAMKYHFFQPDRKLIFYNEIVHCETGSGKIPFNISEYFIQALNMQDIEAIGSCLDKVEASMSENQCPADYRKTKLLDLIDTFYKYCTNQKLDTKLCMANINTCFEDISNINEFRKIIIENAKNLFILLDDKSYTRNYETIKRVKEYICNNLGYQLSLESAASQINLTPKYLSKIFKEITGENFQDYVTEIRMEKSKKLLLESNLTLDNISEQVGYSSSAYFIKQFKRFYGDTPYNYRKSLNINE